MSNTPLVARAGRTESASTKITVGSRPDLAPGVVVGDGGFVVAAGPCSVEGREMLMDTAHSVSRLGAGMLRGGAFKPRTSPYVFQGLGEEALELLSEARTATGLPVVTEVLDVRQLDLVARHADVLQIGARNMYNTPLLAAVGETRLPVLLKRSFAATISELISAAEHIAVRGNTNIIFCERGIRTFETSTRNTLDVGAIPVLKKETHLPVFVDPSHAAGRAEFVLPLACAALAAGADGLIVEVHPAPATAQSDGDQSLSFTEFGAMMHALSAIASAMQRTMMPAVPRRQVLPIELGSARWDARGTHRERGLTSA
ncbi:MAG: 3-deoxy-7-phosphoheptulonate synthase [Gemmatimonadaceae bacterium]